MYAKLFASLYQGTLRGCADEILVFTNLLAHADATGVVDKHWRAISEECGISRERVEAAIRNLEAPDHESRSAEEGGRRIVRMDEHRVWGWRIVNHGKYRAMRDEADKREQNRLAQERWREKNKPPSAEHKQSKPRKPISAQAEAEAEAEADTEAKKGKRVGAVAPSAHPGAVLLFNELAEEHGWPKVQSMNRTRLKSLIGCLDAVGGMDGWQSLLAKAVASDFLMGRTGRSDEHANWRFNFDFLLMPKRYTKLMEGGYDNSPNARKQSVPERGIGAVLAALAD